MTNIFKTVKYALTALLIIIIEAVTCKYLAFYGSVPMLTFCFCIVFAMFEKDEVLAAAIPAACGAVCDVMYGHGFGTYTLVFMLAAIATYLYHDKIFASEILFLITDAIFLTVFAKFMYYLFHINDITFAALAKSLIPSVAVNIICCLILYPLMGFILFKRRRS